MLAHAEDEGAVLAADGVAVDVQRLRQAVVAALLLALLEEVVHQLRVDERGRRDLLVEVLGQRGGPGRVRLGGVVLHRHLRVVDRVGLPGRDDVLGEVGDLLVRRGAHLEALHDRRPDQPEQDRGDEQQRGADAGQQPRAPPDVDEEQHRADDGDPGQDHLRRQNRVVVGERDAGHLRPVAVDEVVAVEPVVGRLGEHEDRDQRGQLHLGSRRDAVALRLQPDAAVQVVDQEGEQQRHHRGGHHEVHDQVPPGQVEDVEPDVLAEVGVVLAEVAAVAPQQVGAPLAGARRAREHPRDDGDADQQPGPDRVHRVAVALQAVVATGGLDERPAAVGQHGRGGDAAAHDQPEDEEQAGAHPEQPAEHAAVADPVEPQVVGPQRREGGEHEQQHSQRHGRDDERAGAPRAAARRAVARVVVEELAHA